jgi:hypothetical protein
MRSFPSRAGLSVLTLVVVGLSACGDHPDAGFGGGGSDGSW